MDMGCHGLAWFRWMLGGQPKAISVQAHMQTGLLHKGRTLAEEKLAQDQGGGAATAVHRAEPGVDPQPCG